MAVQLDTRPPKWTAEFFYNDKTLGHPSTYITNPTIITVGLLAYTKDGPDANRFQLREIRFPSGTIITIH